MRKFNAGYAGNQGPADLARDPDGYHNIGGYLTLPCQDFTYGGGNQGPGENGYQGAGEDPQRLGSGHYVRYGRCRNVDDRGRTR